MIVDFMLRDEKRGYQDENWKARTEERVSGGKTVTGETGAGIIGSQAALQISVSDTQMK